MVRNTLRVVTAAVIAAVMLTVSATNGQAATCTSEVQRQHIWERYYKDEATSDAVLNKKAWTYLAKAQVDLNYCDTFGPNCVWERRVPFPVIKKNRPNDKKYYYVYRIKYHHKGMSDHNVWKYGIGRYGSKRINASKKECERKNHAGIDCTKKKLVKKVKGWSNARTIEAALILRYTIRHGHCPPGQRSSCS